MLEYGVEHKEQRAYRVISDDPDLLLVFKHKANFPDLLQDMRRRGIAVREANKRERPFLEQLPSINSFLKKYLEQEFGLRFEDWAAPLKSNIYFADSESAGECLGNFYISGQNLVISDMFLQGGNDSQRWTLFVSTLMHELIHMQSVHHIVRHPGQKNLAPAAATPMIFRQGLHYCNGVGLALDEAVTEMLALKASEKFLFEFLGFKVEVPRCAYTKEIKAYIDFENRFFTTLKEKEEFGFLLVHAKFGVPSALNKVFSILDSIASRHHFDTKKFRNNFFNLVV